MTASDRLCEGRTCIVTGGGRGLGREYALLLAAEGANVVVNDLGSQVDGSGADEGPAADVAREIQAAGGAAVANTDDIASWDGAERLVQQALDVFGGLDVLVTNAGVMRDRMLVNMSEEEWDVVMRVHLRGTFCPVRHAATHWRARAKAGDPVDARVITTTSASGLYANPGQTNYDAAKAGIATFTQVVSQELANYGVTANAIAPRAATRMTEALTGEGLRDEYGPQWVAGVCAWLASSESRHVTGQVIEVDARSINIARGWTRGAGGPATKDPREVAKVLDELLAGAEPRTTVHDIPRLTAPR